MFAKALARDKTVLPYSVLPLKRQSQLQQTTFINTSSLFLEQMRLDISCESYARHEGRGFT